MSRVLSLAGFEVTLIGRFWVIPEGTERQSLKKRVRMEGWQQRRLGSREQSGKRRNEEERRKRKKNERKMKEK
jgi:hypothetical protein